MSDPCLSAAIELVDETRSMPASEAARYVFDRYCTASPSFRDALVLALVAALATARLAPLSAPRVEVDGS